MKPESPAPTGREDTRRGFLWKIWICLGVVALAEFLGVGIAFLRPRKPPVKEGSFGGLIEAGPVNDFEPNSVTANLRGQFYLSRLQDGGFLAVSRKCTHLGCTVLWDAEKKQFVCPCHASAFDVTGDVASPPALGALDVHPVIIENDIVKVDTGKRIKRKGFQLSQVVKP